MNAYDETLLELLLLVSAMGEEDWRAYAAANGLEVIETPPEPPKPTIETSFELAYAADMARRRRLYA